MKEKKTTPLRERMIEDMRIRGMSLKTQQAHIRAVKYFAEFIGRSPDTATPDELRAYQLHMAAFLRKILGLTVIMTTPDDHDREAAVLQGLTHLIAKVLLKMGPLPTRLTTKSFDLLSEAVSMVQHDAPEVLKRSKRPTLTRKLCGRGFSFWRLV